MDGTEGKTHSSKVDKDRLYKLLVVNSLTKPHGTRQNQYDGKYESDGKRKLAIVNLDFSKSKVISTKRARRKNV